jgi:hypothetical protein
MIILPDINQPIVDKEGRVDTEWYKILANIVEIINDNHS